MPGRCGRLKKFGLWRSLASALAWGARGPGFKSRQPDQIPQRLTASDILQTRLWSPTGVQNPPATTEVWLRGALIWGVGRLSRIEMLESELDKDLFRKAYEQIVDAYTRHLPPGSRANPEPSLVPELFEACWAAECHRQFWKPADLKLVLVAESHVRIRPILALTVARARLPVAAAEAPLQFVRLIYCLAYGDNRLLEENCSPIQPNSRDTPFWSLFADCAG